MLHVRKDRQTDVHPLTISHGMTFPLGDTTRFRHEFDWTGTRDPSAWCALPFTVEHVGGMMEGGWPAIMARNDALCLRHANCCAIAWALRSLARQRCCPASRPCASPRPPSKLRQACLTRCTTAWPSAASESPSGRGRPRREVFPHQRLPVQFHRTVPPSGGRHRRGTRCGAVLITSGAAHLRAQCATPSP